MKQYTIKLAKTIVVEVEAETRTAAEYQALEDNEGHRWDSKWDWAKVTVECLGEEIQFPDSKTYKIIRYTRDIDGENKVIRTGLTLEEAKKWCRRKDTHGDGWFDGYTEE